MDEYLWCLFTFCLYRFTYAKGFLNTVNELYDMAGQHETIAENLNTNIAVQIHNLLQDLKQERKRVKFNMLVKCIFFLGK